jgi:hypothetical protein
MVLKLKEGWEEGAGIYAAIVADPGEKKSPAMKVALEPVMEAQAKLREDHCGRVDKFNREMRQWEADKRENAKNDLPAPTPPAEPRMERTLVEDVTVEALAVVLESNPRGVLDTRDELSGWVRSMDQYKQRGRGADRQFWLSAWSNSHHVVDRKSKSDPLILSRPFVAVVGAIQPGVLPELGAKREDGMMDRFLFAYPNPAPSSWSDDEISVASRNEYARVYEKLRKKNMPTDGYGDPNPQRVHFSPEAKELFKRDVNELRAEMYNPGFPARLKGSWSKLEAYLARLTLILAASRAADEGTAERIEELDVLAAVVLVDYFREMARRVYVGLHGENPDYRLFEDVATFLKERGDSWEGQPSALHEELESKFKPPTPEALTRKLKSLAQRHPMLTLEATNKWVKEIDNQRRFVTLSLEDGVNGGKEET